MQLLYQRRKLKVVEYNECKGYVSDSISLGKMLIGKLKINTNYKNLEKNPKLNKQNQNGWTECSLFGGRIVLSKYNFLRENAA